MYYMLMNQSFKAILEEMPPMKARIQTRHCEIVYRNPDGTLPVFEQKSVTITSRTVRPAIAYAKHFADRRAFVILDALTKSMLFDNMK